MTLNTPDTSSQVVSMESPELLSMHTPKLIAHVTSSTIFHGLLLLALVGECMWPLTSQFEMMADHVWPTIFMWFAVLVTVNMLPMSRWTKRFFILCGFLVAIILMSAKDFPISLQVIHHVVSLLWQDMLSIAFFHYSHISFQTQLILIVSLSSIICFVFQSNAWFRTHIQLLLGMIFIYLALLSFVFHIDTQYGLMRTFSYGLGVQLFSHLIRFSDYHLCLCAASMKCKQMVHHVVLYLFLFMLVSSIGWLSASVLQRILEPRIPFMDLQRLWQFSPFTESFVKSFHLHETMRSGFSSDDSLLGGPMTLNDLELFTATSQDYSYWKAETKSTYTGQGWLTPANKAYESIPTHTLYRSTLQTHEIELSAHFPYNQLIYPGNLISIERIENQHGKVISTEKIRIHRQTGKIKLPMFSGKVKRYVVKTTPEYDHSRNQASGMTNNNQSAHPQDIQMNLQLPAQFPGRIRDLAKQVSASASHPFAKAKAIEQFLKSHYKYSLEEPTLLPQGKDFAEHFLFTDRTGYCSHFSTAMAVMLRTLGIPARWVKGFVPQAPERSSESHLITFRAKHAHAWVEAYFPNLGWVIFEPTPGYSTPSPVIEDVAAVIASYHDALQEGDESDFVPYRMIVEWSLYSLGSAGIVYTLIIIRRKPSRIQKFASMNLIRWIATYKSILCRYSFWWFRRDDISGTCERIEQTFGKRENTQTYREYIIQLPISDLHHRHSLEQWLIYYESWLYNEDHLIKYTRTMRKTTIRALYRHVL